MKKTLYLAMLLVCLLLSTCKKEPFEPDSAKIILGKWESIASGIGENLTPIENPEGNLEFRTDSVLLYYKYEQHRYTQQSKYWFSDTLLYSSTCYPIEDHPNGGVTVTVLFYQFEDKNNKLILTDVTPFRLPIKVIYKRINQ